MTALPDPLVVLNTPDGGETLDPWGVQRDLEALSVILDSYQPLGGWTAVASFSNSWVNNDAIRVARYYRDRGRVYLEGIIKSGTINTVAFTLPAGYRHAQAPALTFAVPSNGALGIVNVTNTGAVIPAIGSNAYFDLSGISFRAA